MKKAVILMVLVVIGLSANSICFAQQGLKIGIHGAYSVGGDIEESEVGYGAQAEVEINDSFSVELAVSRFSDEFDTDFFDTEQDFTTIGLSVIWKNRPSDNLTVYLLAGLNYNFVDMDVTSDIPGVSLETEFDDKAGFHMGSGLEFSLHENIGLFTEYRYTFLNLDAEVRGNGFSDEATGSYNFGLIKFGVNFSF